MRNKKENENKEKGFISLTLVISVSSLLLAFSFMQSIGIAHFFDQTIRKEYRLMSYYFAYSCINQALLGLSHDFFFSVDNEKSFSDLNCSIDSILDENGFKIIKVHGNYQNIIVYRQAKVRLFDDHIEVISTSPY
ncbi:MAG: hypothetical protein AAB637_00540 [Patescibacteria group bacterium]